MFELPPFTNCSRCGTIESVGILSVGSRTLTRRCKKCRHTESEHLPELSKKVIYLDQLAFSEIFKTKAGTRNPSAPSEEFWRRVSASLNKAVLLQQAICPTSDIHSQETTVFVDSNELRQACELIGGDAEFVDSRTIQLFQTLSFADAFLADGGFPDIVFNVDEIMSSDRNCWMGVLHITLNMDFGMFADGIRRSRDQVSADLQELAKQWKRNQPSFDHQLAVEIRGWGETLVRTFVDLENKKSEAAASGDHEVLANIALHPINILMRQLMSKFNVDGPEVRDGDRQKFIDFMKWDGLERIPHHRISAYLFAAFARRYANGQKRLPNRGTMNDIEAIATYGPYVDAMFLDRECAALLNEEPLKSDLPINGRVFSTANGAEFIEYLEELSSNAPADVRKLAASIYGESLSQ